MVCAVFGLYPHLRAGIGVQRQALALLIGPNRVGLLEDGDRVQSPKCYTLFKVNKMVFLHEDRTLDNAQKIKFVKIKYVL
jgi:hypothetical protein